MDTAKFTPGRNNFSINCLGRLVDISSPKIMGILNVTPDSFSDGGQFSTTEKALQRVETMLKEGADFIDIGAQSTRPGAQLLSSKQEIERLGSLIRLIKKEFPESIISLDTFYAETVHFGFNEGIDIVNDISGGMYDSLLVTTVAGMGLPYILMHVHESYKEMHRQKIDGDIILKLNQYFSEKIAALRSAGIKDIMVDPGFGFGKTVEQQHQMIRELPYITFGRYPVLAGISRKSFIYKPLGKSPLEIGEETRILHGELLRNGAKILRVHDVAAAKDAIREFLA